MKPECQQFIALLIDYVAGGLDGVIEVTCREHLDGCVSCVVYMETYRATVLVAAALPKEEAVPAELEARLLRALQSAAADEATEAS